MRSATQRQYWERIHPGNNESDAGFQKITARRLNWYGHVILRKVLRTDIPGKRNGRPKQDACQRDLKSTGLRVGEETDRAMCRRKICSHTGDPT